jgi:hypothetical protein
MGGYGSGRWGSHWKRKTKEESLTLDLNFIIRNGGLRSRSATLHWLRNEERFASIGYDVQWMYDSDPRLTLRYSREGESIRQAIDLQSTPQALGGYRFWLTCPLVVNGEPCQRRCSKLYLPFGGKYFGCRRCYNLSYESCNESGRYDFLIRSIAASAKMDPRMVKRLMKSGL